MAPTWPTRRLSPSHSSSFVSTRLPPCPSYCYRCRPRRTGCNRHEHQHRLCSHASSGGCLWPLRSRPNFIVRSGLSARRSALSQLRKGTRKRLFNLNRLDRWIFLRSSSRWNLRSLLLRLLREALFRVCLLAGALATPIAPVAKDLTRCHRRPGPASSKR